MLPCVTPPFLISWNITKRCNLRCAHCYLDADELGGKGDISLAEAKRFVEEIASVNPGAMLVLTGGEPLLYPHLLDIIEYASSFGITVVLGTNATMLDRDIAGSLKNAGLKGAGVSIDSLAPHFHDRFRGVDGAWERAFAGIESLRDNGISFQMQFTAMRENYNDLPGILKLAKDSGAMAVNVFFLVCTGRGERMTDITVEDYEAALRAVVVAEKDSPIMVRSRCAPHIIRVADELDPESSLSKGGTSGCVAGTGYLRISPEGFVTPCPYIPVNEKTPNLKKKKLSDIWETGDEFRALREDVLQGRCGECEYKSSCKGCRARALAISHGLMAEDPLCGYVPGKKEAGRKGLINEDRVVTWHAAATQRLSAIPSFIRPMVKKGLEEYARKNNITVITPELMAELKSKFRK